VPNVGTLNHDHAIIVPDAPVELTVADVHTHNGIGAASKKSVGEPARRRACVEPSSSGDFDV
jgi:hypothetical protein